MEVDDEEVVLFRSPRSDELGEFRVALVPSAFDDRLVVDISTTNKKGRRRAVRVFWRAEMRGLVSALQEAIRRIDEHLDARRAGGEFGSDTRGPR